MDDASIQLRLIKYAILQVTNPLALICDILVFYYFFRHWRQELLKAPQNHVIFCLLSVSFFQKLTDMPFILYYLRWGLVAVQSDNFCLIWNWLDYSGVATSLHLLTWFCLERHLFIFHSTMMKKQWALILLHYIPLTGCVVYVTIFYTITIFLDKSCVNQWDYFLPLCGIPCYVLKPVLVTVDWLLNYALPIILIIFANTLLFIRIMYRQIRRERMIQWNREKKLILQLIFISLLYMILMTPLMTVGLIQILWIPSFLSQIQYDYFYYLAFFPCQFLSFVIINSLPRLKREIKNRLNHFFLRGRHQARITPADHNTYTNSMHLDRSLKSRTVRAT